MDMNILHINCNYAGTMLHRYMIGKLNELGVKSCIYVPVYRSKGKDVSTPGSEVILSACFKKWHRFVYRYKQSRILKDIMNKCDISAYEIIHAYTVFTDGNVAYNLSRRYNIPYVVAVRSTDVNAFFKTMPHLRKRGVRILRNASKIFFLSESYQKIVLEKYVPKDLHEEILQKSYIIPNGIDDFWLDNINKQKIETLEETKIRLGEKKLRVCFAGLINNRKNPIATQEALKILRNKGWNITYTAVGKTENSRLLKKMCEYPDTVYIEKQPKENLLKIYRENDLFVMPSLHETFGLVYAEAMSQGLPVLYTKNQGFDGQFAEGLVGCSIDPCKPEDIAQKIEWVTQHYDEMTANALKVVSCFCWSDICKRYKTYYEEVIGKEE